MVHLYKSLFHHCKAIKWISLSRNLLPRTFLMAFTFISTHFFKINLMKSKCNIQQNKAALIALFHCSSKSLCRHFYCSYPTSVSVAPSPPCNHTHFPSRAARHRAVLYSFAHFSQRLVPSHVDPYHAPVQHGRLRRRSVIFSP